MIRGRGARAPRASARRLWLSSLACIPAGQGRAETLKQALAAAYKFNPRLDAARATQRATDEEVPRALSGYRPSVNGSADTSYEKQITDRARTFTPTPNPTRAAIRSACGAAAVSRLPDGECRQCRGSDGARRLGDLAHDGSVGAAGGRHGLRRRGARHGDRAPAREQRDGADPRSAGDAGPLQRRRGDAHRRRAGAGAPRRRRGGPRSGQGQPQDQPRLLRARDRPSAEPSGGARSRPT